MNPQVSSGPAGNNSQFFGIMVSKPGINVNNATLTAQDLIYSNNYNTETYYDESNARILIGLLPDGSYGLVVSKTGYDVNSLFT